VLRRFTKGTREKIKEILVLSIPMIHPIGMKFRVGFSIAIALLTSATESLRAHALPSVIGLGEEGRTSLHGVALEENGEPIQGARLIIEEEGSAATLQDATLQDGTFTLRGLEEGVSYSVSIQRAGFLFPSATVTAKVEDYLTFSGVSLGDIPQGCKAVDNSPFLVSAANVAASLYIETLALFEKIRPNQRLRLLSGEVILASDLPQRVEEQYATFHFYSRFVPDSTCGVEISCAAIDVREAKLFMIIELDNLSHERLLINRILRTRGEISPVRSTSVKRRTVSLRSQARSNVERIRRSVGSCY
jgi:hypothetical protein